MKQILQEGSILFMIFNFFMYLLTIRKKNSL